MRSMRVLETIAIPLVVAALAAACGSDDSSTSSDGDGGTTADGSMVGDGSGGGDGQAMTDGGAGDATMGTDGTTPDGTTPDGSTSAGDSVLMHHKNPSRDGVYIQPLLTKAAAATLTRDAAFNPVVQGAVYAQPLFVDGGVGGTDLVIVATEANNVYAFNAATGAAVWTKNLGTPVALSHMPCGNIDPYGVTGTPVIDIATRTMFVGAMTTPDNGTTKQHQVFALSLDDGSFRTGWPVDMATKARSGNTAFVAAPQSQRGALAIVNGTVYVPYGGLYGDCGGYHGWLVGISMTDPTQVQAWATTATAGGVWAAGGVASDGTNVYVTTGNTQGTGGTYGGGEAVVRFTGGGSMTTPAYWAPTNWFALDNGDVDMSGTGPVPFDLAGSSPSHIVVALGKDGNAYLVDRTALNGVGNSFAKLHVASNEIINAPAVYTTATATYVAFRGNGTLCTNGTSGDLTTIKVVPGSPPTLAGSWCKPAGSGSPMVTTTDGQANAIVWSTGAEAGGHLQGFDGDTGAVIFTSAAAITGLRRMNTPIAAKGRIYVPTDTTVVAFKL